MSLNVDDKVLVTPHHKKQQIHQGTLANTLTSSGCVRGEHPGRAQGRPPDRAG